MSQESRSAGTTAPPRALNSWKNFTSSAGEYQASSNGRSSEGRRPSPVDAWPRKNGTAARDPARDASASVALTTASSNSRHVWIRDRSTAITSHLSRPARLRDFELGRLSAGNAQRVPRRSCEVLREKHDLADVLRVMAELPVQRLDDGVRFTPNRHGLLEIARRKLAERRQGNRPSLLPALEDGVSRIGVALLEFGVAVPVRFLSISREEAGPARSHVAGDVLHDQREAVRFGIDRREELRVGDLRERIVPHGFELSELDQNVVEIMLLEHGPAPLSQDAATGPERAIRELLRVGRAKSRRRR